ncbi:MAG: hypothetical protein ACRD3C_09935 [Vicinamibacterales bacterium]
MNLDIYNALNGSAILTINNTCGPQWLQPLRILDARLLQLSSILIPEPRRPAEQKAGRVAD